MTSQFLPEIPKTTLDDALQHTDEKRLYDILIQPLHEELYKRNDFQFMDGLSEMQQLFLSYDYVRTQVGQGGFIQFLANGYAPLVLNMPKWFKQIDADEIAQLIDDVLKVYVMNNDYFKEEMSVEALGKLYEELKEFDGLDKRYEDLKQPTEKLMVQYAKAHLEAFAKIVG